MISAETIKARRESRAPEKEVEQLQQEAKSAGMDWAWVSGATLGATLLAGVFFAAGRSWRDKLLMTLGILPDNVPGTFHEYVYTGLLIQAVPIMESWGRLIGFLLVIALLVFVARFANHIVEDWAAAKGRKYAHKLPKEKILLWVSRTESSAKRSSIYLAMMNIAVLMLIVFGGFIFFVDSAMRKGEMHAREIIIEARKGAKAEIGYPHVQILKQSGEEITKGFAIAGNATAVVIVNQVNGVVTAKLHPLSPDTVVLARPKL